MIPTPKAILIAAVLIAPLQAHAGKSIGWEKNGCEDGWTTYEVNYLYWGSDTRDATKLEWDSLIVGWTEWLGSFTSAQFQTIDVGTTSNVRFRGWAADQSFTPPFGYTIAVNRTNSLLVPKQGCATGDD